MLFIIGNNDNTGMLNLNGLYRLNHSWEIQLEHIEIEHSEIDYITRIRSF